MVTYASCICEIAVCLVAVPGHPGYKHRNNRHLLHSLPSTKHLSVCSGSSRMNKTYQNQNLPPKKCQTLSIAQWGNTGSVSQAKHLKASQNFFGFLKYTRSSWMSSKLSHWGPVLALSLLVKLVNYVMCAIPSSCLCWKKNPTFDTH